MPFGYSVGDHRAFILDIPLELLIGVDPVKIVRPVARRLNSRIAGCCKAYIKILEKNITRHRLLERLHDAHAGNYDDEIRAKKDHRNRRRGENIHEESRENMPQDKVLSNTVLPGGCNMDQGRSNIFIHSPIP